MIVTDRHDGFIVEGGPDGFLAAEPDIQELARQLGIEGRLVDQVARGSTLWTGRRLEPLAEGKAAELLGIQVDGNVGGFRTFATGMADVVEALVACLVPPPRLRTTQGVTAIAQAARGWRLSFTGASSLDAEAVILAIPAWVAARLLAGLGVSAARALDTVLYAPSITVSLAYRADQVPATLEGAGFVAAPDSAAQCAPAPTRGGSTRTGRRGGMPWCGRSSDRGTAIRRRSRTPSSLPSWVSRGIRSGPAHSTGRGGCRVTPTGTPAGWQRSASGSPGSCRSRSRERGSMVRGYRRA